MNTFTLDIFPHSLELMGSVAGEDDAQVGVLRVNAIDYENGDELMIRKAFDFAIHLLKSSFPNVNVAEASASVKYEKTIDNKPEEIVTLERINDHLNSLGYVRKVQL